MRQMRDDGIKRAVAFVTSAFGSYSGCRQYIEDIERARGELRIDKIRPFSEHPKFIEAMTDRVRAALAELPQGTAGIHRAQRAGVDGRIEPLCA